MSYLPQRNKSDIPILTAATCIICALIFIQLQFAHTWADRARWGFYPENAIYQGQYWSLITSAFVHLEPLHLLFNLYWTWLIGGVFEKTFGPLRWLLFVIGTAFISSGLQLLSGQQGIGLSGVGYAFFGFAWVGKVRYAAFLSVVDNRTVRLFVGWGLLCFLFTETGVINIGNYAHLGGALVGAAIAGICVTPKWRIPLGVGVLALTALSIVPIVWNPLSSTWVGHKATEAMKQKDYELALTYLERYVNMNHSPEGRRFAYDNMAQIYGFRGEREAYKNALEELGKVDPEAKAHIIDKYGPPGPYDQQRN